MSTMNLHVLSTRFQRLDGERHGSVRQAHSARSRSPRRADASSMNDTSPPDADNTGSLEASGISSTEIVVLFNMLLVTMSNLARQLQAHQERVDNLAGRLAAGPAQDVVADLPTQVQALQAQVAQLEERLAAEPQLAEQPPEDTIAVRALNAWRCGGDRCPECRSNWSTVDDAECVMLSADNWRSHMQHMFMNYDPARLNHVQHCKMRPEYEHYEDSLAQSLVSKGVFAEAQQTPLATSIRNRLWKPSANSAMLDDRPYMLCHGKQGRGKWISIACKHCQRSTTLYTTTQNFYQAFNRFFPNDNR